MSWSATLDTTRHSFSSVQMMLLSNDAPNTTSRPALSMSAVSSTTIGGLPGPAQMARLPDSMAAFTTPPPPVTTTSRMPGCLISAWALSTVELAMQVRRLPGPPAATTALFRSATLWQETPLALGWTLKTTALPAATIAIALLMIVEVGLVVGVIAPMTNPTSTTIAIALLMIVEVGLVVGVIAPMTPYGASSVSVR